VIETCVAALLYEGAEFLDRFQCQLRGVERGCGCDAIGSAEGNAQAQVFAIENFDKALFVAGPTDTEDGKAAAEQGMSRIDDLDQVVIRKSRVGDRGINLLTLADR
jgi:hypothetical protein